MEKDFEGESALTDQYGSEIGYFSALGGSHHRQNDPLYHRVQHRLRYGSRGRGGYGFCEEERNPGAAREGERTDEGGEDIAN